MHNLRFFFTVCLTVSWLAASAGAGDSKEGVKAFLEKRKPEFRGH